MILNILLIAVGYYLSVIVAAYLKGFCRTNYLIWDKKHKHEFCYFGPIAVVWFLGVMIFGTLNRLFGRTMINAIDSGERASYNYREWKRNKKTKAHGKVEEI